MYEISNIPLNTRVYEIRREKSLDEILAYQIDQEKGFISYTFQTRREIPKVLEIYREIRNEYYPKAFIVPPPSPEMNIKPIRFDDNFALVVGYSKEIPPYLPPNNLIITNKIEIIEEENKSLEMRIDGFSGLNILQDRKEPRVYILYLENVNNLEDLISFISYNNEKYSESTGENKIIRKGWFIVIDDDTSKKHEFTPTDVKIFEVFQ